jgi:ABC-type branched-subunit amino acid transport system substrate-binding protein
VNRRLRGFGVLLASSALVLSGCGRDDGGSDNSGEETLGTGVTSEPCPEAVDDSKGCIYLGTISDLTGPFAGVGVPLTAGGAAFWKRVNEEGGIGDYEIDVTTHVKDNKYDPDVHAEAFSEINDKVLMMAQSLGTIATEAMLRDGDADELVVSPATLGSNWLFEDRVIELGTSYCGEAMNAVDYAAENLDAKSVAAVHFPGDYGDDAMVGARLAAEAQGMDFTDVPTGPGADQQAAAVAAVLKSQADVVVVSTGPLELAAVVGGAVQRGFKGTFIGSIPTWNVALLSSPAGPAIEASYLWASSFPGYGADTPGHEAMREAAGDEPPNEYFAIGWSGGYVMKDILTDWVEGGDLTREALLATVKEQDGSIDSEGMLPEGSGNYGAEPNDAAVRTTQFFKPAKNAPGGVEAQGEVYAGPSLEGYEYTEACYLQK